MTNTAADHELHLGDLWRHACGLVEDLTVEEDLALFHPLMLSLLLRIAQVAEIDPVWPEAARAFVEEYRMRCGEPNIIQFRRPEPES